MFVLPQSHFISALTVVFVNSKSLSSLKIDDTPVDDPSLKVLVANNSDTLKLLKMSSCPHVSPAGTVSVHVRVTQDIYFPLKTEMENECSAVLCKGFEPSFITLYFTSEEPEFLVISFF